MSFWFRYVSWNSIYSCITKNAIFVSPFSLYLLWFLTYLDLFMTLNYVSYIYHNLSELLFISFPAFCRFFHSFFPVRVYFGVSWLHLPLTCLIPLSISGPRIFPCLSVCEFSHVFFCIISRYLTQRWRVFSPPLVLKPPSWLRSRLLTFIHLL